jgi:16S rRNA (adenine1518-N6/adenine1519-N6)-dimethyltransferase
MNHSFDHTPRKRFGQHFLHDTHIIEEIINAVDPCQVDFCVEIGPGLGALTIPLLKRVGKLTAIELDRDVIPLLIEKAKPFGTLTIISQDILKTDLCELVSNAQKMRLIGNLPYNISSPILFHCFESLAVIQDMHFMLQKEVVDRMAAVAGDSEYSRLTVMTQFYCHVEKCFDVGKESFTPPPKVESGIVRLIPRSPEQFANVDRIKFEQLVQLAFSQRRKTIRNNLKKIISDEMFEQLGIDPNARPQNLSLQNYVALVRAISQQKDEP